MTNNQLSCDAILAARVKMYEIQVKSRTRSLINIDSFDTVRFIDNVHREARVACKLTDDDISRLYEEGVL